MKIYILINQIDFISVIQGVFISKEDAEKEILKYSDAIQEIIQIEEHDVIEKTN